MDSIATAAPATPGRLARTDRRRRTRGAAPARLRRVALYSHDTQGLGHVRRNIAVAAALVGADPATNVLLLTGAPEATSLPLPPRTEVVTLPALAKSTDGSYASRVLDAPLADVLRIRAGVVTAALLAFAPDLLVVDKVARGVHGELDEALRVLRETLPTRVVLGLREVLDHPVAARREWERDRTDDVLRDSYDAVWVYGDPRVYDPVAEYGLSPDVAAMTVHTGYLGRGRQDGTRTRTRAGRVRRPDGPYALCLVGGGQDGVDLARAFLAAPLPTGVQGIAVTGPYMAAEQRRELRGLAAARDDVRVLDFVPDAADLVAGAAAVVSMAGYNSVCELLAARRPTLLVPRVRPRREQLVRARRLAARGLVDMLHPDVCHAGAVGDWLARVLPPAADADRPAPEQPADVDLDGLARLPGLARSLVAAAPRRPAAAAATRDLEVDRVAV
ncbi:glycosyltransferase family protein [Aquipuribacter nitratireducens]|uniref:Glycosyltransferase family protein n=1 Tax=Aquipuribacter nitratireducens TaxID=650104 RepID=A0ABW0GM79_9MICO